MELVMADGKRMQGRAIPVRTPQILKESLTENPKIWSFSDIAVGEVQSYTLYNENGNKRRIFQNFLDAKAGDMIIGYESNPVKQIVAIGRISAEQDGEKLFFEKVEGLLHLSTMRH